MPLSVLVVRRARVGRVETDIRIEGDRIAEIGAGLRRTAGEQEIDARGGALLPGLHDHHLHLLASVAAAESIRVGPPEVRDEAGLRAALAAAAAAQPGPDWIRAVGYHQSVAGDLDRQTLDRIVADRPVRVQHRSGILWVCNSAALTALGAAREEAPGIERDGFGRPTGRLWRMDRWLAARLRPGGERDPAGLTRLSAAAAAVGVTGWTDATPERSDRDTEALVEAVEAGRVHQRLHLMQPTGAGGGGGEPAALEAFEAFGVAGITAGPVKILLDDPSLPALDDLATTIARAHDRRLPVAVHCVTRVQLLLTLAAIEVAGALPGDRIEHGAVIPTEALSTLAHLGLTVVTQPNFVAERGDEYLAEVPDPDQPDLWRGRSLVEAGVAVAAGTDAPFGSSDPWLAIRAAIRRQTGSGRVVGPDEAVAPATALAWWWGRGQAPPVPRRVEPGQPADLVVLAVPVAEALRGDGPVPVRATLIGGRVVAGAEPG